MQDSLLLPEEHDDWSTYVSGTWIGAHPDPTDLLEVQCFRAFTKFQRLIAQNDPSLKDVPKGKYVLFHTFEGIKDFGSERELMEKFDDEDPNYFIFRYDPDKQIRHVAKFASNIYSQLQ